ncbi:MAG: SDR family oxidoreductase [Humibacillus sp.]|nr:SDR family oxidoreductase [Humibacillus sp.]MDN5776582.1 SDR family oxidoreductase [Humibacillus sp.]
MSQAVAVVTGAGSGLGREIATTLLGAGYAVALAGRTRSSLEQTAAGQTEALVHVADVGAADQVSGLFETVADRWGRVDLLVNNAGTFGPSGEIDEIEVDAWQQTLDVNLTGSFLCAREAVRVMKAQQPRGGRIVNIGSVSAHSPRPASVAYTATKHAITGLTKAISLDGRPYGIACGQIDIGNATTEMTAGLAVAARQADGSTRGEPTFDPAHVADAVLAMARLPLSVNVQFMTILATTMPFIGRG